MTQWTVRPARLDDLEGVISTFLACWRVNYSVVLGADLAARMDSARARRLWEPVLSGSGAGARGVAFVAVAGSATSDEGDTALCSIGGITRYTMMESDIAEVHSLYFSPLAQGSGLGRRMLSTACESARKAGAVQARLWVFRGNTPSVGFYRAQGWWPDGTERVQPEFGVPEIRLIRMLGDSVQRNDDCDC